MRERAGKKNHTDTDNRACQRRVLRKWLSGFLAVTTAFTMLSGSAASLLAEEPATEYALAGAGSGQDVTVHFGNGEDKDINIHVNPESDAQTLAGFGAEETEADIEASDALTVAYVDQFGDSIGDPYTAVPAPEFDEAGVLNLAADEEYKPVADFAVWRDLSSRAIQYSYLRARIGKKTIKALRMGNPEETSAGEENAQAGNGYYYTYDNEAWEKLEETDAVEFVFTSGKQREYTFEDDNIKVTATLQHAWAIPDGAKLKATQITPKSDAYNYAAYMDALNESASANPMAGNSENTDDASAEEAKPYTEENTLLYDIAFLAVKYDEEGNPIEGSEYEYEPVDGSVSMSVEFKESQLTEALGAEKAEDITVFHLPLAESVKEGNDTTAQATEIKASDITVETVSYTKEDVSLEKGAADSVSFQADSFSTFVFTSGRSQSNYWNGSKKFTMSDILKSLGALTNFAVVAGVLNTGDHIEGNIRVKNFEILGTGAELNNGGKVDTQNNPDKLTVTKTVRNGSSDSETFNFVITDETTNQDITRFSITATLQSDGTVSGSQTFTSDGSNGTIAAKAVFDALITNKHLVRVYELDGNGQKIQQGGKNGTMTVTYENKDTGGEAGEIGNSKENYIGGFTALDSNTQQPITWAMGEHVLGPFISGEQPHTVEGKPSNYIFFGDDNDVCIMNTRVDYFTYDKDLKDIIDGDLTRVATLSTNLAKAYNGDTETTGSKNIGSNLNVINLISTTGNLTDDLKAAGFLAGSATENNSDVITGLLRRGEYLLINIDVGNRTDYTINGQRIYYDNQNPQGNDGYSDLGNHIIYNLVSSSDNQNTFKAYDKNVLIADWSAGLLLAPRANIVQDYAFWVGEIIGARVRHRGAEIHKKTTVSGTNREVTVDVVNTYPDSTKFNVKKKWLDSQGDEITAPVDQIRVKLYRKAAKYSGRMYTVNLHTYVNGSRESLQSILVKRPDSGASPFRVVIYDPDRSHTYSTWADNTASPMNISREGDYVIYSTPDLAQNHWGGTVQLRISSNWRVPASNISIPEGSYISPDRSTVDSDEEWVNYVYLKKADNWTYTPSESLPAEDADGNPYYYYAEEVDPSGNYEISYDNNGIQSGTVTITNTVQQNTHVDVLKKWPQGHTLKVDEVAFELCYILGPVASEGARLGTVDLSTRTDGVRYGTYTVTSAENWQKTIDNLPLYTHVGGQKYQYYYYVKENDVVGYEVSSYENNVGLTNGTITIHNQEKTTSLTVTKSWTDGGVEIADKSQLPAVQVNVYRVKTERGTDPTQLPEETTAEETSASADTSGTSTSTTPNETSSGDDIVFSAAGDDTGETQQNTQESGSLIEQGEETQSTDGETQPQTGETQASSGGSQSSTGGSQSSGGTTQPSTNQTQETQSAAGSDETTAQTDLQEGDKELVVKYGGNVIGNQTGLAEDSVVGFTITVHDWKNTINTLANGSGQSTAWFQGKNYETKSLTFVKQWEDPENSAYAYGVFTWKPTVLSDYLIDYGTPYYKAEFYCVVESVNFIVGQRANTTTSSDTQTVTGELYDTLTLNSGNNWAASLNDLPTEGVEGDKAYSYYYYVEEVPVTGFDTTYSSTMTVTASVNGKEKVLHVPVNSAITVTNDLQKTEIPVNKTWQDSDNQSGLRPSKITLHLLADGSEVQTVEVTADAASGEWNHTFTNLPKYRYDQDDAQLIAYTVTEETVQYYSLTSNTAETDADGMVTSISLVNTENARYSMPATGGEGTRRIYLVSLMLIALAGAGLITVRRRRIGLRR